MKSDNVLFVGGQHHGKMLPVCPESITASAAAGSPLYASPGGGRIYLGYRPHAILLHAGGTRMLALYQTRSDRETILLRIIDAQAVALDNHERALRLVRKVKRDVPLNEDLPDDPGQPARRREPRHADFAGLDCYG